MKTRSDDMCTGWMLTTPTFDEIMVEVDAGNVSRVDHPDGLTIFNYTPRCLYGNRWNAVNREARGLVFETSTGALVARPWGKFWNWHEIPEAERPTGPPDAVMEKYDGALGIGFKWGGRTWWTTRGTFFSEQAAVASRLCPDLRVVATDGTSLAAARLPEGMTVLVEIISPVTKVVVDYGELEELRLIGVTKCAPDGAWYDMPYGALPREGGMLTLTNVRGVPAPSCDGMTTQDVIALAATLDHNHEGFVCRWGDRRIKIKTPAYVEMARVLSGLSDRTVADVWYRDGALPEGVPEEVRADIEAQWAAYDREVRDVRDTVRDLADGQRVCLAQIPGYDRKRVAQLLSLHSCFALVMAELFGGVADYRKFVYKRKFGGDPRGSS